MSPLSIDPAHITDRSERMLYEPEEAAEIRRQLWKNHLLEQQKRSSKAGLETQLLFY